MATFKNLHDLYKAFPNEAAAYAHLENLRWNGNVTCPHCGVTKTPYLKDFKTWMMGAYIDQHGIDFNSHYDLLMAIGKDAKEFSDKVEKFLIEHDLIKT